MDSFQQLPQDLIIEIASHLDLISFWKFATTCQKLRIGFRTVSNQQWRKKYAQNYHLNEQELSCYNLEWLEVYKKRYIKEILFIKKTESSKSVQANIKQPLSAESYKIYTKLKQKYAFATKSIKASRRHSKLSDEFRHTMSIQRKKIGFIAGQHPWYTLLTSNDINEIKPSIRQAYYGLLMWDFARGTLIIENVYDVEERCGMIDTLVSTLSKYLTTHPDLAVHLDLDYLGAYLFDDTKMNPRTPVAIGSVNFLSDRRVANSPYCMTILKTLAKATLNVGKDNPLLREKLKLTEKALEILRILLLQNDEGEKEFHLRILDCLFILSEDSQKSEYHDEIQQLIPAIKKDHLLPIVKTLLWKVSHSPLIDIIKQLRPDAFD